ncbi:MULTISPECIES: hypothetical protein [unclassified Roseitalea]|uniref:hypothetical protein n=1 Tax=unclassified Roseitalea TaxID=2639107 RepID=UPI00273D3B68|nr:MULTISPECIES: hypothetical protein [unclassified Roseitalea]
MSTNRNPSIISGALGPERDMTPEQVAAHGEWTDQEKIKRLEQMKTDALARERDDDQIAEGGDHPDLRMIERAIESVKSGQADQKAEKHKARPTWTSGVQ